MLHVAASSLKKRVPKLRANLPAKEKEKKLGKQAKKLRVMAGSNATQLVVFQL
jgi:hypothetical protein